jgi:hypothetical protein
LSSAHHGALGNITYSFPAATGTPDCWGQHFHHPRILLQLLRRQALRQDWRKLS